MIRLNHVIRGVGPTTPVGRIVYVMAFCLLAAGGCESLEARGLNADGVRMYQQSQYREAIQEFQQAIQADPTNADGYYNLAAAYHRMGKVEHRPADLEKAESFYNQCLDHDPDHRDCYRGLAVLLVEEKRSDEAFRLMERWVDVKPASADAKIELARLLSEFGDQRAAREQLVKAVTTDPNNVQAWAALGKICEESGDRYQALTDYQRSLALDSLQPELAARVAALQTSVGPVPVMPPPDDTRLADHDPLPRR